MPVGGQNNPLVSIVILGWGGEQFVTMCLTALSRQTYPAHEIIVVDNASPDRTAEIVERQFPQVRLIRTETNLGVAGGNNVGLRAASGDVIILANIDTEARPDWIERLVEALQSDPTIGVVGSRLLYPDGTVQYGGGQIDPQLGFGTHIDLTSSCAAAEAVACDTDFVTGAALAIRRQVLEQIGLEDEAYYLIDYEDPDICFRARLAGWRVCYTPHSVAVHYESSTTKPMAPHRVLSSLMGRLRFVCKFWSAAELTGSFLIEETRWLQSLQQEDTDLGTFIRGAMPTLYFKTLQDLEDLADWRNRLGISTPETSRQVLTTVLEQLRRVSLTGSRTVKLQDAPPTSAETLTRLLERWLPAGADESGTRDSMMLQSILSANRRVNSHLPIAYPDWPPGIRPKLVAATQKIVRRLLRWYIDPLVSQQNEINFDLIQTLTILAQEVIWLRQRAAEADRERQSTLEAVQQAIDELRQGS